MENNNEEITKYTWRTKNLTNTDYGRIVNRINDDIGKGHFPPDGLHSLYLLATNSKKHDSCSLPNDVVTINSEILLVSDKGCKRLIRIVFPQHMKSIDDISVYSPLGVACLGAREKDSVFVKHKDSLKRYVIARMVFQPERAKAFNL